MLRRSFLQTAALLPAAEAARPNILLILADDLGWADTGPYGNRVIETPNLDRLAGESMRFTNAYSSAPICSPARAALLTGRSPARLHFEFVTKYADSKPTTVTPLRHPPFTLNLPLEEETIAEALGGAGYRTGIAGKWHLNAHHQQYLGYSPEYGPGRQGFDFAAEDRGSHPYSYKERTFDGCGDGVYPQDTLTKGATGFLRENRARPFFLFASHYYVHTPVHTRCRWLVEKYRNKYGGDAKRAMYAAFVETFDHYVGQLLKEVDDPGLRRNTIVLFTSDNGGNPEVTSNAPLRGSKWNLYEGGVRVPMLVRWPGRVKAGSQCDVPVIGHDVFPTLCEIAGVARRGRLPLDGRSFARLLRAPRGRGWNRDALHWHFPYYIPEHTATPDYRPQSSIRKGDWKLIYYYEDDRAELFDLRADPGEQHDLAGSMQPKARELVGDLKGYLRSVDARLPVRR
ncbi:MAG: sulfatase [Bryobacteraceae bacterium]|nr:sulfatase [Bryobacteraceae bacterium]